jgi:hypothetical protein
LRKTPVGIDRVKAAVFRAAQGDAKVMTLITRKAAPISAPVKTDFDPVEWKATFDERVGILTADGGLSFAEACAVAGQILTHEWLRKNLPHAVSASRCLHCRRMLDDTKVQVQSTGFGGAVHSGCLVDHVASRIETAQRAMREAGLPKQCTAAVPRQRPVIDRLLDAAHADFKRRHRTSKIGISRNDAIELGKLMMGRLPREAA